MVMWYVYHIKPDVKYFVSSCSCAWVLFEGLFLRIFIPQSITNFYFLFTDAWNGAIIYRLHFLTNQTEVGL